MNPELQTKGGPVTRDCGSESLGTRLPNAQVSNESLHRVLRYESVKTATAEVHPKGLTKALLAILVNPDLQTKGETVARDCGGESLAPWLPNAQVSHESLHRVLRYESVKIAKTA